LAVPAALLQEDFNMDVLIISFLCLFVPITLTASTLTMAGSDLTPIVFVPGWGGSTLVDSNGSTQWLDVWEALGLKTRSLALPMTWHNGVQDHDELRPGKILKRIRLLGPLRVGIYGTWLKAAGRLHRPFYQFVYDWRRDPLEVAAEFKSFLAHVSAEHGGAKLDVVGHSMGALYVMAALNQCPELFNQAIMVGAPFSGDINGVLDVLRGDPTGLNDQILSPGVILSFPSTYVFLPEKDSRITDTEGTPENIDFYSVEVWKTRHFGPFLSVTDPDQIRRMETFVETALDHAKQFRLLLEPKPVRYPRIRIVSGNTIPTRARAIQDSSIKGGLNFDFYSREMGDGQTLVRDSVPKPEIPYDLFFSNRKHIHLMSDPVILKLLSR
jgi:pimeloyl-ACP methyl ester carboxylesterase